LSDAEAQRRIRCAEAEIRAGYVLDEGAVRDLLADRAG
jgi:hypothetical protein